MGRSREGEGVEEMTLSMHGPAELVSSFLEFVDVRGF